MRQSECPPFTVITMGHPANQRVAIKNLNGDWIHAHDGSLVDLEDFRGSWDFLRQHNKPLEPSTTVVNNFTQIVEDLHHDDDTIPKVYQAIFSVGCVTQDMAVEIVSAMQNNGILFRERMPANA